MTEQQALELIARAIRNAVGEGNPALADITFELAVRELGLDSLHMMEVIGALEEHLGRLLPDNDIERIESVGDLVALIRQRAP